MKKLDLDQFGHDLGKLGSKYAGSGVERYAPDLNQAYLKLFEDLITDLRSEFKILRGKNPNYSDSEAGQILTAGISNFGKKYAQMLTDRIDNSPLMDQLDVGGRFYLFHEIPNQILKTVIYVSGFVRPNVKTENES